MMRGSDLCLYSRNTEDNIHSVPVGRISDITSCSLNHVAVAGFLEQQVILLDAVN